MMATMNGLTSDLDSLERLMRWIAPRTIGRATALERLEDLKMAAPDRHHLQDAACPLARALEKLLPQSAVISLARRRLRDMVVMLADP
jgi:hypothetical protein